MTAIQVIQLTERPRPWHDLAQGIGLTAPAERNDAWTEFDGDGMLAVHGVESSDPLAGTAEIWLLVDDSAALDALESRLRSADIPVTRGEMADIGATLEISVDDTARVHAVVGAARPPHGDVSLQPLIFTPDVDGASRVLTTLGLALKITSNSGSWAVFDADGGGSIALHDIASATTPVTDPVSLSFEHRGDLDAAVERLTASGIDASVVDEAYNRTLRAPTPEHTELWVNGASTDLYGYTEHG
ncbi:VOC family protein [Microbacterium sp. MPKO10]|uniref:VOC family protein n=1 Tax=Microbacterium sp. MPKO10 TaxID=2989818 RepID=UPI00223587F4|nr:hypothetical protein [Microbacterium sp. MPKO10]MCW4459227.1 hypothetical protein [Microbacterium sp. MPKO10]